MSRHEELKGYELYLVEQWACSRNYLSSLIATFTGLLHHKVFVSVVSVPASEDEWSERLRAYVRSISEPYARRKETPLGTLMITNLGGFPSALSVIVVPEGDFRKYEVEFTVNENLKRMNCSGRAGLSFAPPNGATQTKFRQLYRVSDKIPIIDAAVELVRLCQIALVLFKQLPREYNDGLLCDVTTTALKKWWAEVGTDYFNIEPNDGVLGPSTVSALLGVLIGARNRLNYCNAPVGKDVFDIRATKRGIAHFQRWNRLEKTKRFDRQTLTKLRRSTSKAVNNEGWAVPRAVKSTVAELGGKGGEMVMEMVGTRDKSNIAAVETLHIQDFVAALSGEHCRWLWHGKSRKNTASGLAEILSSDEESIFSDHDPYFPPREIRLEEQAPESRPFSKAHTRYEDANENFSGSQLSLATSDKDQLLRKTVLKSVAGRMSDARAGLGRFRDAVGMANLRGQQSKLQRDDKRMLSRESLEDSDQENVQSSPADNYNIYDDSERIEARRSSDDDLGTFEVELAGDQGILVQESSLVETQTQGKGVEKLSNVNDEELQPQSSELELASFNHSLDSPIDIEPKANTLLDLQNTPLLRSRTIESLRACSKKRMPSFTRNVSVSDFGYLSAFGSDQSSVPNRDRGVQQDLDSIRAEEQNHELLAMRMIGELQNVKNMIVTGPEDDRQSLDNVNHQIGTEYEEVSNDYIESFLDINRTRQSSADQIAAQKVSLGEILSRAEGYAAKLDYELNGLESKVEDVEDGVNEYAEQISSLEARTQGLELEDRERDSLYRRAMRFMLGTT